MFDKVYGGRDDILGALDLPIEEIQVSEWADRWYRVRGLTGDERDRYEQSLVRMKNGNAVPYFAGARARLVALSVVDENGRRLFSEDDIKALGRIAAGGLQRVYEVARRLSGLAEEDVQELEGNSEGAQSDDSGSDSPSL